jgi:alpha-beta hydrolase superfamily lysophospholipase
MTFDLRGHGKTTGQRGHTPSYETLMEDIDRFLGEVEKRFPGCPRFLYGHSLGGNLVLNYVLRRRPALAGVIATGPGLRTALEQQTTKLLLARLLSRLMPTMTMHSGLPATALSHDPEVVQAYVNDPLVHDHATTRFAVEALAAGRWAMEHAAEFPDLPLLLMHGAADPVCFPDCSREFAGQVRGPCTLKMWENLYHEIHNELEKEMVLAYVVDWLNQQLPA